MPKKIYPKKYMSLVNLNTFIEIDFWNDTTIVNNFTIHFSNFIYSIHSYYISVYNSITTIYDNDLQIIAKNDTLITNDYDTIYISTYNNKLVFQMINKSQNKINIYNSDCSKYLENYSVEPLNQVIYIWNNQPFHIVYQNCAFLFYCMDKKLYCYYKLPFELQSYSNFVCFKRTIYILGKLKNNKYVYIKLGKSLKYSNYFSLDYPVFKHISIDYHNDIFKLIILQNDNNLIVISKKIKEYLTHKLDKINILSIPDFELKPNKYGSISESGNLKNLNEKIRGRWVDEIVLDVSNLKKLDENQPKNVVISLEKVVTKDFIDTVYCKSNRYYDYFKWIVDNYDNAQNKTIIFYNFFEYTIGIEFADNYIIHNINMETSSKNIDNFIMTFGKLVLGNKTFYTRILKKTLMQQNIQIGLNCNETSFDYYKKKMEISTYELSKILRFLLTYEIPNRGILYWTPYQYFKINMKLIWNRPKSYWVKIYEKLNGDYQLENIMPYLFYNIFKG